MKFAAWFWMLCGSVAVAAPQPRMPAIPTPDARFDLLATTTVGELKDFAVKTLAGEASPMNWSAEGQGGRGYAVVFPIKPYRWAEAVVQFTPASNGMVTLKLLSPPARTNSVNQRQEIMWDEVTVEGGAITNGSFEQYLGNVPVGWKGGGVANVGPLPAFTGFNYGRTWMNRYLAQPFAVEAGRPVTVRLHARPMPIMGPGEMARITERDTLAHQAVRYYQHGVNAGNFLEVPPGQSWAVPHAEDDFRHMKTEGFDHVRIPVAWHHYTGPGPDFTIAPEFFTRVDTVVTNALKQGLFVILNLHHFDAFTSDPAGHTNQFFAIWRQLARHYAMAHPGIALELLNEPKDAATTEVMNPIYAEAIRIIRAQNAMRTVFVGPGKWNSVDELSKLWLPPGEENVIVTVHCYDPFYFTHQGASWAGAEVSKLKGIIYPGPPSQPVAIPEGASGQLKDWLEKFNHVPEARNPGARIAFETKLGEAAAWSEYYGRPVHVGEFGCYEAADALARARYYADFRQAAERLNLGWAMWDWKAGFHYWDTQKSQAAPGMHEALLAPRKNK